MVVVVSIFPLRNYSRCPGRLRNGCHGARRLERDTRGDVSHQDERCESLSIAETSTAEMMEGRMSSNQSAEMYARPWQSCAGSGHISRPRDVHFLPAMKRAPAKSERNIARVTYTSQETRAQY